MNESFTFALPVALLASALAGACSTGSPRGEGSTSPSPSGGGGGDGSGISPQVPDEAIAIENAPQREGDPAKGYRALVNGGYISVGVPWSGFSAAMSPLDPTDALPGREGHNALVGYSFNVSTNRASIGRRRETSRRRSTAYGQQRPSSTTARSRRSKASSTP